MSTFNPIGNKVILKLEAVEEKSAGGIILQGDAKDIPTLGLVVAVNEETSKQYNIKVGDEVLFGRHTTVSCKLNGENLHIIELDKAFGIFTNE